MASRFRTIIDKICGLDDRFQMLNQRLTLIEETVGINISMATNDQLNMLNEGNVGVGSTVPPDVARYNALREAQTSGNVGSGNVGAGNVGSGNVGAGNVGAGNVGAGNVGVGSAPAGTTETEPDTAVDGEQSAPAGNVGVGSA